MTRGNVGRGYAEGLQYGGLRRSCTTWGSEWGSGAGFRIFWAFRGRERHRRWGSDAGCRKDRVCRGPPRRGGATQGRGSRRYQSHSAWSWSLLTSSRNQCSVFPLIWGVRNGRVARDETTHIKGEKGLDPPEVLCIDPYLPTRYSDGQTTLTFFIFHMDPCWVYIFTVG